MTPTSEESHAAHRLLRELGAARLDHPGGTLLAHLERVQRRLAHWGARPALQLAGLCHACYGTGGFTPVLLPPDRRPRLRELIGAEAEAVVHLYASCDRQATFAALTGPGQELCFHDRFTGAAWTPDPRQARDFAELTAANELDIACVDRAFRERSGPGLRDLFTRLGPLLSPAARDDCAAVLGDTAGPALGGTAGPVLGDTAGPVLGDAAGPAPGGPTPEGRS